MHMATAFVPNAEPSPPRRPGRLILRWLVRGAERWPFSFLFAIAVLSNVAASLFSIGYNYQLIVQYLDESQKAAFRRMVYGNNLVMFSICLTWIWLLFLPLARCRMDLRAGRPVAPERLRQCQRGLINLPFWQLCINFFGWLPGALVFPLGICLLSDRWQGTGIVWMGFGVSFVVSALMATVQTFFLMESFQLRFLYSDFFKSERPTEVVGVVRIPLRFRFFAYWFAVAVVPLIALLAVVLHPEAKNNHALAVEVIVLSVLNSAVLGAVTGRTLLSWLESQAAGTEEITKGNYHFRIEQKRPGDFGRLTDRFNDMAAALEQGRHMRETLGQFFDPEMFDEIMDGPELGGQVLEVTVLFADIRDFTRRSAGTAPEKVVALLNRFLSLAMASVKEQDGMVDKFLGDGILALFGAPRPHADHADLAVRAGCGLLTRLDALNRDLAVEGQTPLKVGIGIHTGPALVGSIGAIVPLPDGRQQTRREYTAIGETVNLAQRIEQLTKTCGGQMLLSEQTRIRLTQQIPLISAGPQHVPGCETPLVVYRLGMGEGDEDVDVITRSAFIARG
jgi:adenylate cyclase